MTIAIRGALIAPIAGGAAGVVAYLLGGPMP
jgi:hypothetical protein